LQNNQFLKQWITRNGGGKDEKQWVTRGSGGGKAVSDSYEAYDKLEGTSQANR
jgi:hypothetical protein